MAKSRLYDYLLQLGLDLQYVPSRNPQYRCNCPFCSDTRQRFYFSEKTDQWTCHNEGTNGNFITFVATYEGITTSEAFKRLGKTVTPISEVIKKLKEKKTPDQIYSSQIQKIYAASSLLGINSKAIAYLESRGISYTQAYAYGLREGIDKFKGRILIPTFEQNQIVYFQGRDYTGKSRLKTLNPPMVKDAVIGKSKIVFNLNKQPFARHIYVVEGPFDALKVGMDAVALLGKTISETQFEKILTLKPSEITVAFDSDAHLHTLKTAEKFSKYIRTSYILLTKGDPGDLTPDKISDFRAARIPFDPLRLKLQGYSF